MYLIQIDITPLLTSTVSKMSWATLFEQPYHVSEVFLRINWCELYCHQVWCFFDQRIYFIYHYTHKLVQSISQWCAPREFFRFLKCETFIIWHYFYSYKLKKLRCDQTFYKLARKFCLHSPNFRIEAQNTIFWDINPIRMPLNLHQIRSEIKSSVIILK